MSQCLTIQLQDGAVGGGTNFSQHLGARSTKRSITISPSDVSSSTLIPRALAQLQVGLWFD